jgi:hypothetical protein
VLKAQSGIPARAPRHTLDGPHTGTRQRRGVNSDGHAILSHFHDARMAARGPGYFGEAVDLYSRALRLVPDEDSRRRTIMIRRAVAYQRLEHFVMVHRRGVSVTHP